MLSKSYQQYAIVAADSAQTLTELLNAKLIELRGEESDGNLRGNDRADPVHRERAGSGESRGGIRGPGGKTYLPGLPVLLPDGKGGRNGRPAF